MKCEKILGLVKYDVKMGYRENKYRYLLSIIILIYLDVIIVLKHKSLSETIGLGEILYNLFQGIPEYTKTRNSEFVLPVMIIVYQLFLMYRIGNYVRLEDGKQEIYSFLHSGNRNIWWLSKCIWVTFEVLSYYVITIVISAIVIILFNYTQRGVSGSLNMVGQIGNNNMEFWGNLLGLPFMASFVLGLWQITVGFFIKPIIGYVVVIITIIVSAYQMNPFLIGNYLMMERNSFFTGERIEMVTGGIVLGSLAIVTVVLGMLLLKRYDVIKRS